MTEMAPPSDAELIEAVRGGRTQAFGVLYERHLSAAYNLARQLAGCRAESDDLVSEAFARVLDILRAGRGPDSAFRAYLLTALRHVAYDKTRRNRKVELTDDVTAMSGVSTDKISNPFQDTLLAEHETRMAWSAFSQLPPRWQAVLWHTEIEGRSAAEAAPLLGLTANAMSALALRARRGLREAYLSAHLRSPAKPRCHYVHGMLAAWARGTLTAVRSMRVEDHMADCADCQRQAADLAEINAVQLRRAA
jgi:RNA polymerase sigma factor (sigma-70 family)